MDDKRFQKKLKRIEEKGERQKAKHELQAKYAEYYPGKKRKISNIMLFTIVVAVTLYTAANFWITYATGSSMDSTLTTCFYSFWGSELAFMTGIRISKVVKSPGNNNLYDEETYEDEGSMG